MKAGTLHRFVPNVKFSRLQRSLKKIHSEELDSKSRVTFTRLLENYEHDEITRTSIANFEVIVYGITIGDQRIAVFNAPVGAASCVAIIEDLIQYGMEKLVLFGTCGVLDKDIETTSIIIPTSALRDEGTSYHYLPASDEVEVNKEILPLF